MNIFDETICAPATSVGAGAVSIIRVSGKDSLPIVDKVVRFRKGCAADAAGYSIHFGTVCCGSGSDEILDEVLVSVFRAPRSYTGEDGAEISCHASSYIVQQIMLQLIEAGARAAMPGEFTKRAFVNGKMDLAQSEAVADVIASGNAAAHRVAMNQLKGGFSKELQKMRDKLLEITSLMELELDFSEEDVEFADRGVLRGLVTETLGMVDGLADTFRLGNAIKNGVPVAIAGAVNAGKSTLLNALLGEDRAIVSDIAGTTRDTIEETMVVGSTLFRFIDTAGIRDTSEAIEKMGIERSFKSIENADIVLVILDITEPTGKLISEIEFVLGKVDTGVQQLVFVANKTDISGFNKNVNIIGKFVSSIECQVFKPYFVELSAKEGSGLDKLKAILEETQRNRFDSASGVLVNNARHYQALRATASDLTAVLTGLDSGISTELVSQDLRSALTHLGTITGAITTDEVLGNIFSKFCIGK